MAIELNNRMKILAGVILLAAAGAGAWVFFLDDFLNEPPKSAPAASAPADASKQAEAAKPAADAFNAIFCICLVLVYLCKRIKPAN